MMKHTIHVREQREMVDALVKFRQDLRQVLYENGVMSNPCWTEDDIVKAFQTLLSKKTTAAITPIE